jgi:hypothetical protein
MDIFDRKGKVRSEAWLRKYYGDILISDLNQDGFYVTRLDERADDDEPWGQGDEFAAIQTQLLEGRGISVDAPCTIIVTVLEPGGKPIPDLDVEWGWPDAPEDPGCGPANGVPHGMKDNRGVTGKTNGNGQVGFAMGKGGGLWPPERGPHYIFIRGAHTYSQVYWGAGWVKGTNHSHIDVTFQFLILDDQEPEPPPADNAGAILAHLITIDHALSAIDAAAITIKNVVEEIEALL